MLRLRLVASVVLLSCALSGCVDTKTVAVDQTVLGQFRGATIVTSQRERPAFSAMTAGKAATAGLFGPIGGAIAGAEMVKAGNEIVRNNDVLDPAPSIEQRLLTGLVQGHGLKTVASSTSTSASDVATLAQQYGSADLLLDVQTVGWGFVYFPGNWRHYKVLYTVKLRLIDTKHAKLLATGFCSREPESSPAAAPTYDQLLADRAALLKKELSDAGEHCVDQFRQRALLETAVANR